MRDQADITQYDSIGVVGLGLTGLSCVRYLLAQGIRPVVFDSRLQPPGLAELQQLDSSLVTQFGPFEPAALLGMDVLLLSPGIDPCTPAIQLAKDADIPVLGDIDVFAYHVKQPIIGITGSNGKSTVTRLTGELLTEAGLRVAVGGNIGVPVLDLLQQPADVYVLELSSFQLDLCQALTLQAATILNISDDHLDRYGSMYAYSQSKHQIYRHTQWAIWNRDQGITAPHQLPLDQQLTFGSDYSDQSAPALFGMERHQDQAFISYGGKPLLAANELQITGMHNLLNVQAALALVHALGVDIHSCLPAARRFQALPHRCQLVGEWRGVRWVNDSKATNIGAAEAAINGVRELVPGQLIVVAGGDGKGQDFSSFRTTLMKVDTLILFGKDADRIAPFHHHVVRVTDLAEAVQQAHKLATAGSMVLLSPACSSLDMFRNFEHRGEQFVAAVEALHGA
jgi:UDP-N-acetylmuramoylalanine--D-glutamate ligase